MKKLAIISTLMVAFAAFATTAFAGSGDFVLKMQQQSQQQSEAQQMKSDSTGKPCFDPKQQSGQENCKNQ